MNLNELAKAIHRNAVDHGWWENERPFGEITDLFHSELSEALEEYRKGHNLKEIYTKCKMDDIKKNGGGGCGVCQHCPANKPEGIPIELADCVIRILDYAGRKNFDIWLLAITHDMTVDAKKYKDSFGDFLAKAHSLISQAFDAYKKNNDVLRDNLLGDCVGFIMEWCELNEIDIEKIIEIKHEYNKSRPYKHGNKVI